MSVLPLSLRPLAQTTTAVFIVSVEAARVCQVSQDERKRAGEEWSLSHFHCGVRFDTHPWLVAPNCAYRRGLARCIVMLVLVSECDCVSTGSNRPPGVGFRWRFEPGSDPREAQCWWSAFPESDYFQADIEFRFGNPADQRDRKSTAEPTDHLRNERFSLG